MDFYIKNGTKFLKVDTYNSYVAYNWVNSDINASTFKVRSEAETLKNRISELYSKNTDTLTEPLISLKIITQ